MNVMPDQAAMAAKPTISPAVLADAHAPGRGDMTSSEAVASLLPLSMDLAGSAGSLVFSRGLGSRLFDAQGEAYLDLCMGHGALLLGHGAAAVKDALRSQIENGWLFGFPHNITERVARLIHDAGPANERVMICASESDATLLAMRAARAYTARDTIAVFSGATHGLHDGALVTAQFEQAPAANDATLQRKIHRGAGIPASTDESVMVLAFGTDQALETIHHHRHKLAAVIVEPIPSARPSLTHKAWLTKLDEACRASGVLLILDETFSGFRLSYGGAQEFFDLTPDLVTYGNALGGGLPIGAVAGRAAIMSVFGGGDPQQRIFCGTTHAGNPLSAAAAEAVLTLLSVHRETIYPQLHQAASSIATAFNTAAENAGDASRINTAGSIFQILFDGDGHSERAFYRNLLDRRVIVHASKRCFLSTAHTVGDIGAISGAMIESLQPIKT